VRVSNNPRSQWVLSGHRLFQQLDERRIYAEFRPSDGIVRGVIGPITNVGALHTYTVGLRFSCQCLIGKYDGGDLVLSTINPDTWARPSRPDWIGKATYTVNHIPGTSSARTHFDQMRAQRQSTDAWSGSPCGMTTFNNSTLIWDQVKPACDDAEVWTISH
jgi:hypothetical protein